MLLSEALLLRKSLAAKVAQLTPIKLAGDQGLCEIKSQRRKISEEIDEVTLQIPKITLSDLTETYDFYATQLRKIDGAIQKANWTTTVDFTEESPKRKEEPKA